MTRPFPGLALLAFIGHTAMAASSLSPVNRWLPSNTLFALEITNPQALLAPLLDPKVAEAITAQPFYRQLSSQKQFRDTLMMVRLLEGVTGTNWQAAVQILTGGGITLAFAPTNAVILSIDSADESMLTKVHEFLRGVAQVEANKAAQPARVASTNVDGVATWSFNNQEAHAIIGNRFILCNQLAGLKEILSRRDAPAGSGLAAQPGYQAARQSGLPSAIARGYVNLAILKHAPRLSGLFKPEAKTPLGALLLAGFREALRDARWLALSANLDQDKLILQTRLDGQHSDADAFAKFAQPSQPGAGALPNLAVPRQIAGLSFYRDLHAFYAAKDKLFPDRTSGLIFFENMMGIFFSGRDLTDEVLAQPKPEIRFVVAEQKYDPAIGTPEIQLPAFAVVLQLRHPEEFDEVVEEAWQKALGLVNFTRGQQALPGLIIGRPVCQGVTFTAAHYSSVGIKDRARIHQRYNVCPSLAMPGDYLILSSTEELARDLIESLKQPPSPRPVANVHSLLELNGRQLASILAANRDALVRNNMLKSGKTPEAAQTEADTLLTVARALKQAKLSLGSQNIFTEARLEIQLNVP